MKWAIKSKSLPIIGVWLEEHLHRKANRALDMKKDLPAWVPRFSCTCFHCGAWRKYCRHGDSRDAVCRSLPTAIPRRRFLVSLRWPGLTVGRTSNWLVRKLARGEQTLYEWMARQRPVLIIRLNIDENTAHARKLDHDIKELRDKIAVMPQLKFNGARVCELDAAVPLSQVLEAALLAIKRPVSPSSERTCGTLPPWCLLAARHWRTWNAIGFIGPCE